MKKQILVVATLVLTTLTFAQKKELKKADRALEKQEFTEAMTHLKEAEALLGQADADQKAEFHLYKAEALTGLANGGDYNKLREASEELLKAKEMLGSSMQDRQDLATNNLRIALVNSAISDQNKSSFATAAEKLENAYKISPADTSYLYYAAGNLVNGKDFDKAITLYEKLMNMGYTGIQMQYIATNTETGKEDYFGTKEERDNAVKFAGYEKPVDKLAESVQPDILQKVTLIYINKGENEKALAVMQRAREANPDDVNLMRSEADLAYKMGDMDKYNKLMEEVVKTDPNNPELYYNLGVSAASIGRVEKAKEYYGKALELKPDYSYALINMAGVTLQNEAKIIEEMNGLGTSSADNKRYDELKEERENMYKEALPYLERASKAVPDNVEVIRTLMNMYSQLGMYDKQKEMKAKLETME